MERGATRVVVLSEDGTTDLGIAAELTLLNESGCILRVDSEVTPGRAVRIDNEDRMLLGEVVFCAQAAGGYRVSVRFHQALNSSSDLAALMEALLGEHRRAEAPAAPQVKLKA